MTGFGTLPTATYFVQDTPAGRSATAETSERAALKLGRVKGNRLLEERSYLQFVFPQGGDRGSMRFVLPFYENISVAETQEANYQRYDLLARSSSLYSYTGSPSRKIKLKFNLTVPHLLDIAKDATPLKYIDGGRVEDKKKAQKEFFDDAAEFAGAGKPSGFEEDSLEGGIRNATAARKRFHKALLERNGKEFQAKPEELRNHYDIFFNESESGGSSDVEDSRSTRKTNDNILNVLVWWINLIRASTKNNADDVILGPPVVRLTHGALYNDIPCLCTKYTITPDSTPGYDKKTLMERIIRVTMDLEEARVGNIVGEYAPGNIITKDNNAGWEAIIEHNTTDPYTDLNA